MTEKPYCPEMHEIDFWAECMDKMQQYHAGRAFIIDEPDQVRQKALANTAALAAATLRDFKKQFEYLYGK